MNDGLWYTILAILAIILVVFGALVAGMLVDLRRHRAAREYANEERRRAELERVLPREAERYVGRPRRR
jgi:heme/copper-type cytochrome/quinol oxidase subunit 2